MKIRTKELGRDPVTEDIETYVFRVLDGTDYDGGLLEAAQRTATNACGALGRLLDWMSERGILDAPTVSRIAADYRADTNAEFEDRRKEL